jgi:hypothetical protein
VTTNWRAATLAARLEFMGRDSGMARRRARASPSSNSLI